MSEGDQSNIESWTSKSTSKDTTTNWHPSFSNTIFIQHSPTPESSAQQQTKPLVASTDPNQPITPTSLAHESDPANSTCYDPSKQSSPGTITKILQEVHDEELFELKSHAAIISTTALEVIAAYELLVTSLKQRLDIGDISAVSNLLDITKNMPNYEDFARCFGTDIEVLRVIVRKVATAPIGLVPAQVRQTLERASALLARGSEGRDSSGVWWNSWKKAS